MSFREKVQNWPGNIKADFIQEKGKKPYHKGPLMQNNPFILHSVDVKKSTKAFVQNVHNRNYM